MARKTEKSDEPTFADRWAPDRDPTWHAEYHDRNELVTHLDADERGHVPIADEAADRAAASMGLLVVGAHQEPVADGATTPEEG